MVSEKFEQLLKLYLIGINVLQLLARHYCKGLMLELKAAQKNTRKALLSVALMLALAITFWWMLTILFIVALNTYLLHNIIVTLLIALLLNFLVGVIVYLIGASYLNNAKHFFSKFTLY